MALESLPKIAPALFSADQDLIQIYNKKTDTLGVINPSYIKSSPSGVAGAIQFSDGSAFASDASNLFWDNVNKRLGVGTNTPTQPLSVNGQILSINGRVSTGTTWIDYDGTFRSQWGWLKLSSSGDIRLLNNASIGGDFVPTATTHIKGSGSTSATTSLLVQNSGGSQRLKLSDDGLLEINYINNNPLGVFLNGPSVGSYGILIGCVTNGGDTAIFTKGNNSGSSALRVTDQNIGASRNHLLVDYVGATGFNLANGTTTVNASAQVEIVSTTKGFLKPRMTDAQIRAIASPAIGLEAFNTDLDCPVFYSAAGWRKVSHSVM